MAGLRAVTKKRLADIDTPVSAFMKLCQGQRDSFLFESGEAVEDLGRYSIVAWDPIAWLKLWPNTAELTMDGRTGSHPAQEFFSLARRATANLVCEDLPKLPFVGSLVGYVGYDAVRLMEKLPPAKNQDLPIAELCYPSRFVVFDHLYRMMTLVAIADDEATGKAKLKEMDERLGYPLKLNGLTARFEVKKPPKDRYMQAVAKAKEYILDGDIFQVVLSDQFTGQTNLDPIYVYRWLRVKNPSPYMFFLNFGDCQLVGASPETLVKLSQQKVLIRPIAGTRGRSSDPVRDKELEREMMNSEKERAEHIMLVDLARNDAGRVSEYGSVKVEPYMTVERFSHVMHIVSQVEGILRPDLDAWDAFMAGFPAGTVSGAPKVRAMEIIDELECLPRGPYAGGVGRFGPGQEMDTCIAIRMIQFQGDKFTMQAGAGIVADSIPEMEYEEITQKAAQGIAALKAAGEI